MTSLASNVMSLPTFKVLITNFDFSVFYRYLFGFSGLDFFVTFSLFVHQQTFYILDKKIECKSLEQSTGCPRKKSPLNSFIIFSEISSHLDFLLPPDSFPSDEGKVSCFVYIFLKTFFNQFGFWSNCK